MKLLVKLSAIVVIACTIYACKEAPKQVSGYEYTINSKNGGQIAQPGEYAYFTLTIKDQNDSILNEMKEGPNMPVLQVPLEKDPTQKANPVLDLLGMIGEGDNATIIMPVDSLGNVPAPIQDMDYVTYTIEVKDVMTEVEFKADQDKKREAQMAAMEEQKARIPDVEALVMEALEKFKSGADEVRETTEGLRYIIHKEGEGENAKAKDYVSVNYYGVLQDGTMFDNSFRTGFPFQFTLGRGEVIKGWDLGIPLLKPGGSATLYIPYDLAYGKAGSPPVIPAEADLIFFTELVEIN